MKLIESLIELISKNGLRSEALRFKCETAIALHLLAVSLFVLSTLPQGMRASDELKRYKPNGPEVD